MQIYIHSLVDDSFINQETGEHINYSHAFVYEPEHHNEKTLKGRRITKYRTVRGLIDTVDASALPGWFNAEFQPGSGGRITLTSLQQVKK